MTVLQYSAMYDSSDPFSKLLRKNATYPGAEKHFNPPSLFQSLSKAVPLFLWEVLSLKLTRICLLAM